MLMYGRQENAFIWPLIQAVTPIIYLSLPLVVQFQRDQFPFITLLLRNQDNACCFKSQFIHTFGGFGPSLHNLITYSSYCMEIRFMHLSDPSFLTTKTDLCDIRVIRNYTIIIHVFLHEWYY